MGQKLIGDRRKTKLSVILVSTQIVPCATVGTRETEIFRRNYEKHSRAPTECCCIGFYMILTRVSEDKIENSTVCFGSLFGVIPQDARGPSG